MATLVSSLFLQLSTLFQLFCCCLVTEVNKLHSGFRFLAAVRSAHVFLSAARRSLSKANPTQHLILCEPLFTLGSTDPSIIRR